MATEDRRPLKTRNAGWARRFAAGLARMRISPNGISAFSMIWALAAAACLVLLPRYPAWETWLLLGCAAGIQLRLLCNMLDGMVAVEGGLKSPTGDLWNEVPDRVADSLILIGAGYACAAQAWALELGWGAALIAALTAYIRALGTQLGKPGCFHGPMAKPHRMFTLTVACLFAASPQPWLDSATLLWYVLMLICAGALLTCLRRLAAIRRHLYEQQADAT